MKPHIREIYRDLKAASRIGHPDALQSALDGIRALDANAFPPTAMRPLGEALIPIRTADLRPLLSDPDPAIRGITAVALAHRYRADKGTSPNDLLGPANDRSQEVREALHKTLTQGDLDAPMQMKLYLLAAKWLDAKTKNLLLSGLSILPYTNPPPDQLAATLMPLQLAPDYGLRTVIVNTLNTLSEKGHAQTILSVLDYWTQQDAPNIWVITRTLSSGWAKDHSPTALVILHQLADKVGSIRPIARAIARHEPPH